MLLQNSILIVTSYVLLLYINKKTQSNSVYILLSILTFHHVIAYLYAFQWSFPEYEVDPASFIRLADECTNFNYCGYLGQYLYANYLSKILAFGYSIYSVYLLNVIFFVVSLFFFIKIACLFCQDKDRKILLILYGLWPSVIFYTTLNYRETFELYLLIAAVYFALTGSKSDNFFRMFVSMILLLIMGFFHIKGLIFLAPILFIILVSYKLSFTFPSVLKRAILLVIMIVPVYLSQGIYYDFVADVSRSKNTLELEKLDSSDTKVTAINVLNEKEKLFEKNKKIFYDEKGYAKQEPDVIDAFMRKVVFYRNSLVWVRTPRTAFYFKIDDENLPKFLATYSIVYLEYLFSPFIFQINSLPGLLAYLESVLRLVLFVSALFFLRKKPEISILLTLYLAITAMWAIGVVSFGAGLRHHVQTNWLLVLLGVPVLAEKIRMKYQESKNQS